MDAPGGIGAAVASRSGLDMDGREHLRVRISDGYVFGWLEVVSATVPVDDEAVEVAVEQRAGDLPESGRLDALEALSPLSHR